MASRRKSEDLLRAGRVTVNGAVASLGDSATPGKDEVAVDGKVVTADRHRYIVLNKPAGYTTTMSDRHAARTVMELLDVNVRLFPAGRLDRDTEGLLIFTNDGDFANIVTHPRYGVRKTYRAELADGISERALKRLRAGVRLEDGMTLPARVRWLDNERRVVEVTLHEGRKRVVRRMFKSVGYPVQRLMRTRVGPVRLARLASGTWRDMTDDEVSELRAAGSPRRKPRAAADAPWRKPGAATDAPRRKPRAAADAPRRKPRAAADAPRQKPGARAGRRAAGQARE